MNWGVGEFFSRPEIPVRGCYFPRIRRTLLFQLDAFLAEALLKLSVFPLVHTMSHLNFLFYILA